MRCSLQALNAPGKVVLFSCPRVAPWCKVAHLSIVAVICKVHFWPDQKDFAVQADYSAVVSDISVLDGHY